MSKGVDEMRQNGLYTESQANHLKEIIGEMKNGKKKGIKESAFYKVGG